MGKTSQKLTILFNARAMSADVTKILSANGSKKRPSGVTWLPARASLPS